ncbi:MAG: radical SAM protein [Lachnospiraceae bacterium]|nr:radical SAM protein [Lachnospiraceae bacterium]
MDKMKRFLECYVPIRACNMRCKYCYVTQNKWWDAQTEKFDFKDKIKDSFSQERLGGVCMINMCATGETLLNREVIDILKQFLENGHYVMLVTNGTLTERFQECCNFQEEYRKRLFFKISFHYLELKRIRKLDVFFSNIRMIQNAGISFTVELTPDDSYIPYINEIKQVCLENLGVLCHVTVCRDECKKGFPLLSDLTRKEFVNTWKTFNSELFRFKESIFEQKRKEFCYAGQWGLVVDLKSGNYQQCYKGKKLGNIYDLSKQIHFLAEGHHCREGHCFNGHAFLGFGLIPELNTPYYAEQRNRILDNGTQWLSPEMESFMRCKLENNNVKLNGFQKVVTDIKSLSPQMRLKMILGTRRIAFIKNFLHN